jgi:hypothetical protein
MEKTVVEDFIKHLGKNTKQCYGSHIIDRLPYRHEYPRALEKGKEFDAVIRHFQPFLTKHEHYEWLLEALYEPREIASLAKQFGTSVPRGFSFNEMLAREEETEPCDYCERLVKRYRCKWSDACVCQAQKI